jgi:hypothetical protein
VNGRFATFVSASRREKPYRMAGGAILFFCEKRGVASAAISRRFRHDGGRVEGHDPAVGLDRNGDGARGGHSPAGARSICTRFNEAPPQTDE